MTHVSVDVRKLKRPVIPKVKFTKFWTLFVNEARLEGQSVFQLKTTCISHVLDVV